MEIPLKPDGRPDIEKLMAKIEQDASASIKQSGYSMPRFIPTKARLDALEPVQYSEKLKYLNLHWNDWSAPINFSSHRPVIGKVVVNLKKVFQKFVRTILSKYFESELKYQEHLVCYLNDTAKYIDDRDAQIFWSLNEKIDKEVNAVNCRTDELFDQLACEMAALKEKIAVLESEKRKVA